MALAAWLAAVLTGALAAAPAWSQTQTAPAKPDSESSVGHVGNTLGLTGQDVPPLLAQVKADPYKAPSAPACDTIPVEITQLSALIGPDIDAGTTEPDKSLTQRGMEAAKGFVPYSGVVRFMTGANKKDKEMREAVMAGFARRGFLRGMEVNMKCHEPPAATAADATPAAKPAKKRKAAPKKG